VFRYLSSCPVGSLWFNICRLLDLLEAGVLLGEFPYPSLVRLPIEDVCICSLSFAIFDAQWHFFAPKPRPARMIGSGFVAFG
jgi:hypothetical protein